MAKISDFEICRQSWSYYAIAYKDIVVGHVECDGDEWTAHSLRGGFRTKDLNELFDKYIDGGKPIPSEVFAFNACASSRTLRPRATRMPRRIV